VIAAGKPVPQPTGHRNRDALDNAPRSSTIIAKVKAAAPAPGRSAAPRWNRQHDASTQQRDMAAIVERRRAAEEASKTAADGSNSGPKNGSRDRKQQ
jgi:hypothetical protein